MSQKTLDAEKKSARCRTCFEISKLPSVCSWEEATLDAAHSVWPQGSVSVNITVFKPIQITPCATEHCRETLGTNTSVRLQYL